MYSRNTDISFWLAPMIISDFLSNASTFRKELVKWINGEEKNSIGRTQNT